MDYDSRRTVDRFLDTGSTPVYSIEQKVYEHHRVFVYFAVRSTLQQVCKDRGVSVCYAVKTIRKESSMTDMGLFVLEKKGGEWQEPGTKSREICDEEVHQ